MRIHLLCKAYQRRRDVVQAVQNYAYGSPPVDLGTAECHCMPATAGLQVDVFGVDPATAQDTVDRLASGLYFGHVVGEGEA